MRKVTRTLLAAGLLLAGTARAREKDPEPKPKGVMVKTVISVDYQTLESFPPVLKVTAVGQVPTGGWSGAALTPRKTEKPPEDGIYDYDLTAVPPDGIATQVISKVTATNSWRDPPKDMKGIRVHGAGDGVKTVKLADKK